MSETDIAALVKRLREPIRLNPWTMEPVFDELCLEAADMLEQLAAERGKIAGVSYPRMTPATGEHINEMREHARSDPLWQHGDMQLMWVNEGDMATATILAALEPAPDARTYADGVKDAAKVVERCLWPDSYARYFADAIRALLMEKPHD